jgi:hypothetical protein
MTRRRDQPRQASAHLQDAFDLNEHRSIGEPTLSVSRASSGRGRGYWHRARRFRTRHRAATWARPARWLLLGDSSSQVDRPPGGPGPRSCVGTRLATKIGAPLFVSRGEELCGMSAGSGQPPPVGGIAQICRSACTAGRLCRVRLPLPGGGEAHGLSRRSCASRPAREPGSTPSQLSLLDLDTEAPVQCARRLLSDQTPANRRSRSPLLAQKTSASTFWLDLVRPCRRAPSTSRCTAAPV